MSMKQEIETWVTALQRYDNNEFEEAIRAFGPIADTSKILFNCGVIRATLGEHEAAVDFYRRATTLDPFLAIAYFQSGVSHFLIGEFERSLADFNDTLLYLRGNRYIDYSQLGLKFKLYSCEVLFNRGLSYIYLQQTATGLDDLSYAAKEKEIDEHNVIDEAITEKAEGFTVFSIPVGTVFRPSEAKVKNIRARDYMGKPTLIAAARQDQQMQHQHQSYHSVDISADSWARDDRPAGQISYAATNLVRPGLSSRTRQQSEPPLHRNMYPPTPPPETDKLNSATLSTHARNTTASVEAPARLATSRDSPPRARSRSSSRRPEPLDLGTAAFERPPHRKEQQRRPAVPQRSASERPATDRRRIPPEYDDATARAAQPDANNLPLRSKTTRERLFGALDNELPDPPDPAPLSRREQRERSLSKSHTFPRAQAGNGVSRSQIVEEAEEDDDLASDEGAGGLPTVRSSVSTFASGYSAFRRTASRPPALKRVRVKVRLDEDTRYIIVAPDIPLDDFVMLIVRKFALNGELGKGVKLKLKDEEGDMITLADQADLDMFVGMCKDIASKEGSDMGKLEVWVTI